MTTDDMKHIIGGISLLCLIPSPAPNISWDHLLNKLFHLDPCLLEKPKVRK